MQWGEWLSWPNGVLRLGVVFTVAAASVAALLLYPGQLRELGEIADRNAGLSYADRDVAGGNSVMPEQSALYELRGRIPEDATYRVDVGEPQEGWTDLTAGSAEPFLRYWLMPRRPSSDATWIVCVGCDPAGYPAAVEEWSGAGGVRLLRLPT